MKTIQFFALVLSLMVVTPVFSQVTPGSITPATQTIASGSSATLNHSGGTGITSRQWQVSTNNGSTWTVTPAGGSVTPGSITPR